MSKIDWTKPIRAKNGCIPYEFLGRVNEYVIVRRQVTGWLPVILKENGVPIASSDNDFFSEVH